MAREGFRHWFSLKTAGYRRPVGVAPRPDRAIQTLPAPEDLQSYEGMWVAVRGTRVIEHAPTARQLAVKLRALGAGGRGATAQFVPPPARGYRIGVG